MRLFKNERHRYTYADYLTWSDKEVGDLVNGTPYVREPPAPAEPHQVIVLELGRQASNALEHTPCRVYIAPFDVRLPEFAEEDVEVDTVVQPDVLIVSEPRKVDIRGMRGAPDWIAEVLSPSTATYDRIVKLPVYERAGVREVWLVDPIDRRLAIYRLEEGRYGNATILQLKGQTQLAAVPGVAIDWDRALAKRQPLHACTCNVGPGILAPL